jgi:uncharacterized secreted protein with C-terminal beta-propeller domain
MVIMDTKILPVLIVGIIILVGVLIKPEVPVNPELKKFSSCEELKNFVKTGSETDMYYGGMLGEAALTNGFARKTAVPATTTAGGVEEYSTTNIQVAGVDEADIVKNDGKYIYVVSGKKVVIIDAYPAENSRILSEIEFNGTPQEIFINKDKLIVFGYGSSGGEYYSSKTFIKVYDISDRENPTVKRDILLDGNYYDSRMIGDYVYIIINQPYYYREEEVKIPEITYGGKVKSLCGCPDVYYFDFPDYSYTFTTITAINTQKDSEDLSYEVFLMGNTQNMYVSLNNIYITYTKRLSHIDYMERIVEKVFIPNLPVNIASNIRIIKNSNIKTSEKWQKISEAFQDYYNSLSTLQKDDLMKNIQDDMINLESEIAKETEKTVVHKISIENGKIKYESQGQVPGNVLNQFSMDEHEGYFRIATTTGQLSRFGGGATSQNHVYILDNNLNIVGRLEDLAKGEKIYSARFVGDRCYLVTFKKIDPLFVIDVSDPYNPTVLGKLKIPGYSDYLHPYDENHLIGIGKETVEAEEGNFAWYQGVKISLFDVSDVSNPKEISKYEIGDRGTDSEALRDHKAFLFSKSKNLLVIPILLAEIDEEKYPVGVPSNTYGDFVWQGAYVLQVTLDDGFVLKGRVTHVEDEEELLKSGYYYESAYSVKRSLYMDDVLYTLSDKMIKMNKLDDMKEINKVSLPYEEGYYPRYYG